jgi:hypothetical protein
MSGIKDFFNRAASANPKPWAVVLASSVLVGFILGFFQPFGIGGLNPSERLRAVICYTFVTAAATAIAGYLLPLIFRNYYSPEKWTVGKMWTHHAALLALIVIGNFATAMLLHPPVVTPWYTVLFVYILVTLLIGLIPATVSVLIVRNISLKENLAEARDLNCLLSDRLRSITSRRHVESAAVLLSGDTKEALSVYPDSILYIESTGNYVKVNYLSDDLLRQKLLRATITRIEKDLEKYDFITKCHRAYLVNTLFISGFEGNSQTFRLRLRHVSEAIPVARSCIKTIRERL